MEPSNPAPEARRSARRRLVRGAFAAPAVLALYSGGAVAMASNLRCVYNRTQHNKAYPQPTLAQDQDQFVRVQLRLVRRDGKDHWYLSGDDFQPLAMGGARNDFLHAGQWWEFNPANGGQRVGEEHTSQPDGQLIPNANGPWVAVRFDMKSGIVTIDGVVERVNSVGSAISAHCWASFLTAAR